MALITIDDLSIGFRGPPLLDHANCQIEPGQRIGLLGRNGSGKTTLMRILCGQVEPDSGQVRSPAGTTVSLLPQDVPRHLQGTVFDVVAEGLKRKQGLEALSAGQSSARGDPDRPLMDGGDELEPAWRSQQRVEQILSRMELEGEARFDTLSSGRKRRVLLARTLVSAPDLLLLDEPTNHLDIESIAWLEGYLARWTGSLIFVTHDRMFLRKLASRILEIDRGRLFDWSCDYDTFLERKESMLAAEEKQNALFDKKLAQEEKWIRQGIKARRTRNEGRVRALARMRHQRSERRAASANVRMEIPRAERSGNLVAKVTSISFGFGEREIIRDFSTTIMRGDKVGIIGPNGVGKTTLLRLLLGQLPPHEGNVRLGTNLRIAYFDQLREQLDPDRSVQENVADDYDSITATSQSVVTRGESCAGGATDSPPVARRHILGYLRDFLFTPQRARTPVRFLSGGERNRVLLARLFAKPANLIVLDEPTNDLDTETLELLEERLVQFEGTVLLVSHDRAFLNNVVTSTIAMQGGRVEEYVGGYDDWLRQSSDRSGPGAAAATSQRGPKSGPGTETKGGDRSSAPRSAKGSLRGNAQPSGARAREQKRRLTYKQQQELASLPATIEQWEAEVEDLHQAMAREEFYRQPGEQIAAKQVQLRDLQRQLAAAYDRWDELERLAH